MHEARWLVCAMADVPTDDRWLSDHERAVLAGLRFEKRRRDWRLGRFVAHCVCGERIDEVRAAADGAPEGWRDGQPADVSLSISHTSGVGLCVVGPAGTRLGCDLERIEPRSQAFIDDYLTVSEAGWVRAHDDAALAANLVWSAKESALKALRTGLRRDTRSVEVSNVGRAATTWAPFTVRAGAFRFAGWWRRVGEFVLTLAGDGPADSPPPDRPCNVWSATP